jgi:hypothetical protein
MEKTETPFPAPGIYFDMPEDVYHSIPAFSKSLVKKFRISDIDAWEAIYGTEDDSTEALDYGSALHCLLLEGREAFESRYCKAFSKADHPGALETVDDLKAYLDSNGQTYPKSASKGSLIHIVQTLDPAAPILDAIKAEYRLACTGKTEIPAAMFDEILTRDRFQSVAFLADKQATEISLFWLDEHLHIPCKARIDALSFRKTAAGMIGHVGDIKTFTNTREKPIAKCVADEVGWRGYHIDGVFYTRALKATPKTFHDAEGVNWPDFTDTAFELLFIEKGKKHPNVLPREIVVRQFGNLTELGQAAMGAIQDAANRYRDLHAEHGKRPWNRPHALEYITEADVPLHLL